LTTRPERGAGGGGVIDGICKSFDPDAMMSLAAQALAQRRA
jgi:hypothetical protein